MVFNKIQMKKNGKGMRKQKSEPDRMDSQEADELRADIEAARYYKNMADRLDAESRLLFPITFAIFCTVYWGYYTWSDTLESHMVNTTVYSKPHSAE